MIEANPYTAGGYQVLKVETHLHTLHSDGHDSVDAMFSACLSAGYDAVALTDHNTLSGLDEARDAADKLGLILIPGVEVTTFHGHAVALGVARVPEWRDLESRGMDALAEDIHADGGLLCVAHPAALGSPVCSGCTWDWPIEAGSIDLWEILSAPRPNADVPLALWQQMLARGGRAAPVAAGDVHSVSAAARLKAATYVYTRERSAAAVLEALRERLVFASSGSRLDFWLEGEGVVVLVGGRASASNWTPRTIDGAVIHEMNVPDGARVLYAELRDAQGRLEAVSAPIWIDTST